MYKSQLNLNLAAAFYRNDNFKSPKTTFSVRHKTAFSAHHRLNTSSQNMLTILHNNQSNILIITTHKIYSCIFGILSITNNDFYSSNKGYIM